MTEHIDRKEFARLLLEAGNRLNKIGPPQAAQKRKHFIRPADLEPSGTRQVLSLVKWIGGTALAIYSLPSILVTLWFVVYIIIAIFRSHT